MACRRFTSALSSASSSLRAAVIVSGSVPRDAICSLRYSLTSTLSTRFAALAHEQDQRMQRDVVDLPSKGRRAAARSLALRAIDRRKEEVAHQRIRVDRGGDRREIRTDAVDRAGFAGGGEDGARVAAAEFFAHHQFLHAPARRRNVRPALRCRPRRRGASASTRAWASARSSKLDAQAVARGQARPAELGRGVAQRTLAGLVGFGDAGRVFALGLRRRRARRSARRRASRRRSPRRERRARLWLRRDGVRLRRWPCCCYPAR